MTTLDAADTPWEPAKAPSLSSRLNQPLTLDPRLLARVGIVLLTLGTFLVYAWWSLAQNLHFQDAGFDLGIFSQVVDHYAHFTTPSSTIDLKYWQNYSGDHFEPILVLLVPLWWVWPHADTLLVAQAALVATSVPFVYRFTARRFSLGVALVVSFCYAANWGVQSLFAFQFHEVAFLVPLIAIAIERADAGKIKTSLVFVLLTLLVKEDTGILVVAFALLYATVWRARKAALALLLTGVATFLAFTQVLVPHFAHGKGYFYWKYLYGDLSPSLSQLPSTALHHPLRVLSLLVTPATKVVTLLRTFLPWLFLPVASPLFVLAVPLLLERFWATPKFYWIPGYHYNAPLVPILALAFVDTLSRIVKWLESRREAGRPSLSAAGTPRLASLAVAAALVLTLVGFPAYTPLRALLPMSLSPTATEAGCYRVLDHVPAHATVEATGYLAPHLVGRDTVFLPGQALWHPQYLVVQDEHYDTGALNHQALMDYLKKAQEAGYHQVDAGGTCSLWASQE